MHGPATTTLDHGRVHVYCSSGLARLNATDRSRVTLLVPRLLSLLVLVATSHESLQF